MHSCRTAFRGEGAHVSFVSAASAAVTPAEVAVVFCCEAVMICSAPLFVAAEGESVYRRCQVDASYARAHPAPGVHVVESCEARYQACSQGGIITRPDLWPCGPAPM